MVGSTWPFEAATKTDGACRRDQDLQRLRHQQGLRLAYAWRGTKDGPFSALVWCKLADCMREGVYLPPLLPGQKRHRTAGAEEGEGEEHQEEGSIADAIAPIYQIERVLGQR